jgi:filamentous hemagglutinin family protein
MTLCPIAQFLLLIVFLLKTTLTVAEVVLDGTLGPAIALEGPNFDIRAEFGQQHGNNLFHSFEYLNLNKMETASFFGPNTVENIITRITGGKSDIDGTLFSNISQANLYLINPDGFLFGPNARLDIQGSFYLSTASELRLGDSGVFDTRNPEQSILVSAPPVAFGFLDVPTLIEIKGSQLATNNNETLSILAGEINLEAARLRAVSGRINLAAIAQANQLTSTPNGLSIEASAQLGNITIENNSTVDVGKQGAGDIYIRGGKFVLDRSSIAANTEIAQNSGVIAIEVNELKLTNQADIDSRAFGSGQGGQIMIDVAGEAKLSEQSQIRSSSINTSSQAGNAGNIVFNTHSLNLENSIISTITEGPGIGGDITIKANHEITLINSGDFPSAIQASSRPKLNSETAGDAGQIFIQANDLTLSGSGTQIDNSTFGAGQGGSITLDIANTLHLNNGAVISADSFGLGNAGNIYLNTSNLLMNQGTISTAAETASGGNIIINVPNQLALKSSLISATVNGGVGNGGNLAISNPRFFSLIDSSIIANASGGNGGLILIISNIPTTYQNSSITASSETGIDGEVKIDNIYNVDLNTLPIGFLDASNLIKKPCTTRTDTNSSSFFIKGRGGLPNAPDDLQTYIPIENE